MTRTVIYRSTRPAVDGENPVYGGPGTGRNAGNVKTPDGYIARVAKYVPAETLALVLPLTLILTNHLLIIGTAIAGLIGTPLYLQRRAEDEDESPPPQYYFLVTVAYVAWILAASSPLREAVRVPKETAFFTVAIVGYFLPLLDDRFDIAKAKAKAKAG